MQAKADVDPVTGQTIVMVTHDPRAGEAARRTTFLDKGQLSATSPFALH